MSSINLVELIPRCHAGSRAKGFWDVTPNRAQQLMLVVSELAEALEADRKGRNRNDCLDSYTQSVGNLNAMGVGVKEFRPEVFEAFVKDNVGDEMADAYIRLCDYAGGYYPEYTLDIAEAYNSLPAQFSADNMPETVSDNLGEALLKIVSMLASSRSLGEDTHLRLLPYTFLKIARTAEHFGIDLATHIDLKLRYNATRPAKHGKAY